MCLFFLIEILADILQLSLSISLKNSRKYIELIRKEQKYYFLIFIWSFNWGIFVSCQQDNNNIKYFRIPLCCCCLSVVARCPAVCLTFKLNSSTKTEYIYSKLKESQSRVIISAPLCSAESPSLLGHHTVNWVMQDYLITKYRSPCWNVLLCGLFCTHRTFTALWNVRWLLPWSYHKR